MVSRIVVLDPGGLTNPINLQLASDRGKRRRRTLCRGEEELSRPCGDLEADIDPVSPPVSSGQTVPDCEATRGVR